MFHGILMSEQIMNKSRMQGFYPIALFGAVFDFHAPIPRSLMSEPVFTSV